MSVIDEIAAERHRQIETEGWSAEHDDEHGNAEMSRAAAAYALSASLIGYPADPFQHRIRTAIDIVWPWSWEWFKPKNVRRDLIRAAALLVAEIERLDRQEARR